MRVAILSDTHGLLRPSVVTAVAGCDLILHAGDVGDPAILDRLRDLAPLYAVRGNVDVGGALGLLPMAASGTVDGRRWRMTHRPEDVPADWFEDAALIVHGHTHRPVIEQRGRTLVVNPGSCGPRRFHLPVTLAILRPRRQDLTAELIDLEGERHSP